MNSAIILFVVCAAAIGIANAGPHGGGGRGGGFEKMKEAYKQCAADNGVDEESMKGSKHGEVTDNKVKCAFACVGKKMGKINEDGTINKDVEKMRFPPNVSDEQKEAMKKRFQECAEAANSGNSCEDGYKFMKCIKPKRHGGGGGGRKQGGSSPSDDE